MYRIPCIKNVDTSFAGKWPLVLQQYQGHKIWTGSSELCHNKQQHRPVFGDKSSTKLNYNVSGGMLFIAKISSLADSTVPISII